MANYLPGFGTLAYKQIAAGLYNLVSTPSSGPTYANDTQWVLVNTTKWDLNDSLTIKNIAGYVETRLANNYNATPEGAFLDTVTVLPNGNPVASGGIGGGGGAPRPVQR